MKDGRLQEIGIALAGDLPPRLEYAFDEDGEPLAISSRERAWRDIAEELHATLNGLGRRLAVAVVSMDDEIREQSWGQDPDIDALRKEAAALFGMRS